MWCLLFVGLYLLCVDCGSSSVIRWLLLLVGKRCLLCIVRPSLSVVRLSLLLFVVCCVLVVGCFASSLMVVVRFWLFL